MENYLSICSDRYEWIYYPTSKRKKAYEYECICGKRIFLPKCRVTTGNTKSCGCIHGGKGKSVKHGMSYSRIYGIYDSIRKRCTDENGKDWLRYGGRGIKNEWKKFEDFYEDMGDSYNKHIEEFGEKNTSIDRVDNDGNYCKENCRWSTLEEQGNNKRNTRYISYKGETLPVNIMAKKYNISSSLLYQRLMKGWSSDRCIEKRRWER